MALTQHDVQLLLNAFKPTFDSIASRLDGMDRRFEVIDQRFDAIDGRFESIDRRFEVIDQRFDTIDDRFDEQKQYMEAGFNEVNTRIDILIKNIVDDILPDLATKKELEAIASRTTRIEKKLEHLQI